MVGRSFKESEVDYSEELDPKNSRYTFFIGMFLNVKLLMINSILSMLFLFILNYQFKELGSGLFQVMKKCMFYMYLCLYVCLCRRNVYFSILYTSKATVGKKTEMLALTSPAMASQLVCTIFALYTFN